MNIEKSTKFLSKTDSQLGKIISQVGIIELKPPRTHFESLVNSVISQQISTKAAATVHKRLLQAIENEITPEKILNTSPDVFRIAGLSRQKTKYMAALAEAFIQKADSYDRIHEISNEEVIKLLTEIKGIGVWTAQMFMMFSLLREDVFPIGDLGIRRSMEKHFYGSEKQEYQTLIDRAEIWAPHRTVACFYLWRGLNIDN